MVTIKTTDTMLIRMMSDVLDTDASRKFLAKHAGDAPAGGADGNYRKFVYRAETVRYTATIAVIMPMAIPSKVIQGVV